MVAIEHCQKSTPATTTTLTNSSNNNTNNNNNNNSVILSNDITVVVPITPTSPISTTTTTSTTTTSSDKLEKNKSIAILKMSGKTAEVDEKKTDKIQKEHKHQRNVDIKFTNKALQKQTSQELTKKMLNLDLTDKELLDELSLKSPKSPISARLPHQTSLTSSVDVEDRKTLREALYQGIFSRHRRTIFAFGSFLRMLRSRTSQYNTIRSSSEGEDVDEVR